SLRALAHRTTWQPARAPLWWRWSKPPTSSTTPRRAASSFLMRSAAVPVPTTASPSPAPSSNTCTTISAAALAPSSPPITTSSSRPRSKAMKDMTMPVAWQMTLLASDQHPLVEELKTIAIDELSPIEAINKLYELQRKAKRGSYDFGREPDKPIALAGLHRPRRHLRARSHHRGQCPPAPILRPAHRPPR